MAEDNNPDFSEIDENINSIELTTGIMVIGVGGGGNNAINHMYRQEIKGISYVVCNTDEQALRNSPVPERLLIGPTTTKGRGAGNKPELAREAAEESAEDIGKLFDASTHMVFITAGMGGGTGTGAAPVVARIAKEKGVLTIGIVTIPFLFEGEKKILKALAGADEMSKYVDALLIINNERLTDIYKDLEFTEAFAKADDTLTTAAASISELITCEGYINLDFNDVNTTLRDGGVAIISSGCGEGENRVTKAINDALNSPLLKNRDVEGSKHILFNIYFSRKAQNKFVMNETNELTDFMAKFAPEVDVIWGVAFDDSLGEKVRVTLLASGFEVSLKAEETHPKQSRRAKDNPPVASPVSDQKRLVEEYGGDKIQQRAQSQARARYIVLTPEQFDNDEVLEIFEKNPTYNRDTNVKDQVKKASEQQSKTDEPTSTTVNNSSKPIGQIMFG
ncbi:MAG: cell division protein FtsZ [Muribaculaceae bacterium]